MPPKEITQWSRIVRRDTGESHNVWTILHIRVDLVDTNVISQSGPYTTEEVCALWDTMLAWSRYIELEGVGLMKDSAQFCKGGV